VLLLPGAGTSLMEVGATSEWRANRKVIFRLVHTGVAD
jgi:hypothetical protein